MGVRLLLVIVSIAVHVFVTSSSADDITFCVVPEHVRKEVDTLHASYGTEQCTETKTWNEYLAQQYRYFNEVSNITFLFRHGTHYMNRSLEAKNVSSLRLSGSSPHDVLLTSALLGESTPLIFSNFFDVTVEGMNIELCASIGEDQYIQNGLIYFSNGTNATVQNVKLENLCNGSEIYGERTVNMLFIHINVTTLKESACGSFCLYTEISGTINVINSTFKMSYGGINTTGKFTFLNFGSNPVLKTSVIINRCSFTCNNVLNINLASTSSLKMLNVIANGCVTRFGCTNSVTGGCSLNGTNGTFLIANSIFEEFQSAIIVTRVVVTINDSVFRLNQGNSNDKKYANALSIGESISWLENVTFTVNGIGGDNCVMSNAPTLLAYDSFVFFNGCTF